MLLLLAHSLQGRSVAPDAEPTNGFLHRKCSLDVPARTSVLLYILPNSARAHCPASTAVLDIGHVHDCAMRCGGRLSDIPGSLLDHVVVSVPKGPGNIENTEAIFVSIEHLTLRVSNHLHSMRAGVLRSV